MWYVVILFYNITINILQEKVLITQNVIMEDEIIEHVVDGAVLGGGIQVVKQVITGREIDLDDIVVGAISGATFGLGMGILDDIFD